MDHRLVLLWQSRPKIQKLRKTVQIWHAFWFQIGFLSNIWGSESHDMRVTDFDAVRHVDSPKMVKIMKRTIEAI